MSLPGGCVRDENPALDTYKGEYIFYREDKQKRLHEIYCKNIDKESVALQVERGKEAEIGIDLPKNG